MQLAIPVPLRHDETGLQITRLDRGAWRRFTFALDGREATVRWSAEEIESEVIVETRVARPAGAQSIRLLVRHRPVFLATAHTDARRSIHWGMHLPSARDRDDFFTYAARWIGESLAGERWRHLAFARALTGEALEALRVPAQELLARLAPALRTAARRFPPALRVRAYGALSRDEKGWARQTLSAGVGHLLFALALMDVDETVAAGAKLVRDLAEGRKLNDALDEALTAWAAALATWGRNVGNWNDDQVRTFHVAARKQGEARQKMLAQQRILIRRAGPQVDPVLLLLPPPLRFAPEDVPATPGANAAWYRVLKVPRLTVEAHGMRHPVPFLEAFCAFASKHAAVIARPPSGLSLDRWLDGLCEVFRAGERTPSRATDSRRLRSAVDAEALRSRRPEARIPYPWVIVPDAPPPRARLPAAAPPREGARRRRRTVVEETQHVISDRIFEDWSEGEARVSQILTLRQLRGEGIAMSNCVADYRRSVEAKRTVILHAEVAGNPLTIGIDQGGRGWFVSELKGWANRRATSAEWAALLPFFQKNSIYISRGAGM